MRRKVRSYQFLGAVALTRPRSLLRFTFHQRSAACARESATAKGRSALRDYTGADRGLAATETLIFR
jgi:hypothetical protein